jgi:hypothetical protein
MLAKSFAQKVDSNSREMNRQLWKKNSRNHPILKRSPSVIVDNEFILFWGQICQTFFIRISTTQLILSGIWCRTLNFL